MSARSRTPIALRAGAGTRCSKALLLGARTLQWTQGPTTAAACSPTARSPAGARTMRGRMRRAAFSLRLQLVAFIHAASRRQMAPSHAGARAVPQFRRLGNLSLCPRGTATAVASDLTEEWPAGGGMTAANATRLQALSPASRRVGPTAVPSGCPAAWLAGARIAAARPTHRRESSSPWRPAA